MDSVFLKAKNIILQACVSVAQNNGHGHMTSRDIWHHLRAKNIQRDYSRLISYLSKQHNWWRSGLPRKFRNGYLIRELREDLWNAPPETEINSVRYQLKQANKHIDALKIKYDQAVVRANENYLMLSDIRKTWRRFQDLMTERR